jgi:hypothetical protein
LPPYCAVIEWLPTVRLLVAHEADPDASGTEVQSAVAPSKKVTEPAGVPLLPVAFAVKVTLAATVEGFGEELNDTVAGAVSTCCATAFEVPAL